jgi:anti-sigma regulatory factor (Ser/Thr protein kinase)/anti-anti-sigma regulatory factor
VSQTVGNMRILKVPGPVMGGEFDSFRQEFGCVVADSPAVIVLDCGALKRLASSHIGLLWECNQQCRDHGIRFQLKNPSAAMVRTLEALDLRESFALGMAESVGAEFRDKDIPTGTFQSYIDCIPLDREAITLAEDRFVSFLHRIGAGAGTTHELRTVVYEIATNIRTHSGLEPTDHFTLEATANSKEIALTFTDTGVPFDPTIGTRQVDPTQAARTAKRRGFGLLMIQKLVDNLEYRRDAEGANMLNIRKRWRR